MSTDSLQQVLWAKRTQFPQVFAEGNDLLQSPALLYVYTVNAPQKSWILFNEKSLYRLTDVRVAGKDEMGEGFGGVDRIYIVRLFVSQELPEIDLVALTEDIRGYAEKRPYEVYVPPGYYAFRFIVSPNRISSQFDECVEIFCADSPRKAFLNFLAKRAFDERYFRDIKMAAPGHSSWYHILEKGSGPFPLRLVDELMPEELNSG